MPARLAWPALTPCRVEVTQTAAMELLKPQFASGRLDRREDRAAGGGRDVTGLVWQATAVAQHISDGLVRAPEHPLAMSIAVLETIDDARAQLGYPPS